MNSWMKEFLPFFLIIITILFLSCGASHKLIDDIVFKDENFSYANLKHEGLIIAGMCSDVVEVSNQDRLKYSSTFSNVLIEKLRNVSMIQITNPIQLIDTMGRDTYFNMMEDFDSLKALRRVWADTLGITLPDAKYMLFAYIVNENIVDESYDRYVEREEGRELETEYKKTYFITVDFLLYDLFQKELVWENSIFNKAQRTETRTTDTGCFESCVNDLFQQILFGQPAEISREEVFEKIVEKFAEDIAKT